MLCDIKYSYLIQILYKTAEVKLLSLKQISSKLGVD